MRKPLMILDQMASEPLEPKLGGHGGHRTKGRQGDSVTLKKRGNSRAYIVARLQRDNELQLLAAVLEGRLSAFKAAQVAGWGARLVKRARRTPTVDIKSLVG
jgi:hypothetical protein